MATVAGNLVNASPIGDLTIFFLALDAHLTLNLDGHERTVPLRSFYKGYKIIDRAPGEIVTSIRFKWPGNKKFHFEKVSKRTHLDIASVNTAMLLETNGRKIVSAGVSAGGVAPVPLYLAGLSAWLQGKEISEKMIGQAIEAVYREISPISDARGTAAYKRLLLGQLLRAHFIHFYPELEPQLSGV
jgi:xanthine dehydrogenase small subunit